MLILRFQFLCEVVLLVWRCRRFGNMEQKNRYYRKQNTSNQNLQNHSYFLAIRCTRWTVSLQSQDISVLKGRSKWRYHNTMYCTTHMYMYYENYLPRKLRMCRLVILIKNLSILSSTFLSSAWFCTRCWKEYYSDHWNWKRLVWLSLSCHPADLIEVREVFTGSMQEG